MIFRIKDHLVFVLAANIDQGFANGREGRQRGEAAVDVDPVPARTETTRRTTRSSPFPNPIFADLFFTAS